MYRAKTNNGTSAKRFEPDSRFGSHTLARILMNVRRRMAKYSVAVWSLFSLFVRCAHVCAFRFVSHSPSSRKFAGYGLCLCCVFFSSVRRWVFDTNGYCSCCLELCCVHVDWIRAHIKHSWDCVCACVHIRSRRSLWLCACSVSMITCGW